MAYHHYIQKIPPTELEGYYQWLPLDLEKPEEDGYWLMYQNALNGEHIKNRNHHFENFRKGTC